MLRQRKAAMRFSPLLLDENEEYEGDWVSSLVVPTAYSQALRPSSDGVGESLRGRLRLCSMSVVFDPDDLSVPVLKFPLKLASGLNPSGNQNAFTLTTTSLTCMKPNNLDLPYKQERHGPQSGSDWVFSLVYAKLESVLPRLMEALYLSQQSRHELKQMLEERRERKLLGQGNIFDTAMYLRDAISEKVLVNLPCVLHAPLVNSPGRLAITSDCVYFQPLHDIEGNSPCKIQRIRDIVSCCKKKYKLQECIALEVIFWKPRNPSAPRWDTPSAFFAFQTRRECDEAWRCLSTHEEVGTETPFGQAGARAACRLFAECEPSASANADASASASSPAAEERAGGIGGSFRGLKNAMMQSLEGSGKSSLLGKVTGCWQRGLVSNYNYLMLLNLLAGRTFNDLSQWPVMPWVLKDYTSATLDLSKQEAFRDLSKPVGALNKERLGMLKERFSLMPEGDPENPPFLYGTHYSNPGYVMYWLVRAAPGHLLRLQSGKFDAPDRMFHSMQESWTSVLSNPADVKELIPEFFVKDLAVKFLSANEALPLGSRQNGKSIDAVELPPWADSTVDFVIRHRQALDESDYVNGHVNEWIDLIFGYKQRGPESVKADNVFHHMTYATSRDLEKIEDAVHRDAIEQQAQEFGQTPNQLFEKKHPLRMRKKGGKGAGELPLAPEENEATCIVTVVKECLL